MVTMKKLFVAIALLFATYTYAQRPYAEILRYAGMTTAEMNGLSSPQPGWTIYNTTTNTLWMYYNATWNDTGGAGGTDDQTAAEVPFTPYSTLSSTNVQTAIQELLDEAGGLNALADDSNPTLGGNIVLNGFDIPISTSVQAGLDAQDQAAEISFSPYLTIGATNVQLAIQEMLDENPFADNLGTDGDKGDITVGGTGTTLEIDANAVTSAEIADNAVGATEIAANAVIEAKLDADNAPTDGQMLSFVTATGRMSWVSPPAGGAPLAIYDETLQLGSNATKMDFQGSGVTVTEPVSEEFLVTITDTDTNTLGPDGDKGDITVGGTGTTLTIDSGAVDSDNIADGTVAEPDLNIFNTPSLNQVLSWDGSNLAWATDQTGAVSDGDKGDITVSSGGTVYTIDNQAVTLAKFQDIATASFLGRITAATGSPEVLTASEATSLLDVYSTSSTQKGLVPGSNSLGSTYFLNADGTWAVPPVDGTGTDNQTLSFTSPNLSITGGNSVDLSALQDGTGTDDQIASEVPSTPSGNLAATDVQGALNELQSDIDTRAVDNTVVHLAGSEAITGSKYFNAAAYIQGTMEVGDSGFYLGEDDGVLGQRWYISKNQTTDKIQLNFQNAAGTNSSGAYTNIYTLDETGVPTENNDLTDKAYVDAAISGFTHTGEVTGTASLTIASSVVDSDNIVDGSVSEPDLNITNAPGTSQVLTWNGTNLAWANDNVGGVTDGDKGDITISASGATYTIDADAVTESKLDITNAAVDGYALKWNGTASRFEWAVDQGAAAGSPVTVQDEGTPLTTDVTLMNFVGNGVTVTEPVADQVTVTINQPDLSNYVTLTGNQNVAGTKAMEAIQIDGTTAGFWGLTFNSGLDQKLNFGYNSVDGFSGTNLRYTMTSDGVPVDGTDIITKTYADANYSPSAYLPLAGGTITGLTTVSDAVFRIFDTTRSSDMDMFIQGVGATEEFVLSPSAGTILSYNYDADDWRIGGNSILTGSDLSGYLPLTGGTLSGSLTINAGLTANYLETSTAVRSLANAADFDTEDMTVPQYSIWTVSNTTGSTGFPQTTGQALFVKGAGDARTFGFWKTNTITDPDGLYSGYMDGAGAWVWNEMWTDGSDGAGSGLDADLLDGISSASFAQLSGATFTGNVSAPVVIATAGSNGFRSYGSSTGNANISYMSFYESNGTTRQGYIGFPSGSNSHLYMTNDVSGQQFYLSGTGGNNGLAFYDGASTRTVWHSGNDGSGSLLDADLLDGITSANFLRSNATDSYTTGTLSFASGTVLGISDGGTLRIGSSGTTWDFDRVTDNMWIQPSASAGSIFVTNGAGTSQLNINPHATTSTSKDTGALVVTNGGMGVEGAIYAGGDITAFNTSDRRLKENISPITGAVNKLKRIGGYEYDWNNKSYREGHDVGVIAQEVQRTVPEAVRESTEGYLQVNYDKLVPLLIEAVKEQQTQIEELRAEIKKLKNE